MKLTAEKVDQVFMDCLFKEHPQEGTEYVPGKGIMINIGLHSPKFANQILNKTNKFYNVNGKLYKGKTCYTIRFAKRDSIKLINILFGCSSLYLQRKYSKIEKYIIKGGDAK